MRRGRPRVRTGAPRPLHALVVAAALCAPATLTAMPPIRKQDEPPPAPSVLNRVGIDQKIGRQLPLDLPFRDDAGRPVTLGRYVTAKPTILVLVYYGCPSLCTVTLNNLTGALRAVRMDVGDEFDVLAVSFDPTETAALAAAKKRNYVKRYNRPGADAGWHFLTGDDASIRALTQAVGFRYFYDERTKQYAHASVVMTLTPGGTVSRYLHGFEQSPNDLRLALVEASGGKVGTVADRALLLCYRYDPASSRYGFAVMSAVRAGGVLTILALGTLIVFWVRRERRTRPTPVTAAPSKPDNDGGAT